VTDARHSLKPPFAWTDDACALLRRMWLDDGASGTEIAAAFGGKLTRNAVIGKAYRMGLTRPKSVGKFNIKRLTPKDRSADKRAPKKAKPRVYVNVRNVVHNIEARRRDPGMVAIPAADRIFPLAKPWLERKFGECAFPIGEGADALSCSTPTERTYCPACEAVMFQPVQPTMKRTMRLSRLAA
jgi:GcrA cell cycle regulator